MHPNDLNNKKDILKCTFCRNPLSNMDINVKKVEGDFVSVACNDCKNKEPKFLICCCSDEPRELSIEMANSEIGITDEQVKQINNFTVSKIEESKPSTVTDYKPRKQKKYL